MDPILPSLDAFSFPPLKPDPEISPLGSGSEHDFDINLFSAHSLASDHQWPIPDAYDPAGPGALPLGLNFQNDSTSSLASSLLVNLPDYASHSRHSSVSVTEEPPKLQIQTQELKMGRMRSSSRVAPYDRQRSESVSERSDSSYNTPFTSTPLHMSNLSGGFNRMSLHRRSSSNLVLRKHRSTSILGGNQESIRQRLATSAEDLRALPSASQQDKARSSWVKKWLQSCYTVSPGHTVPRQGLYHSYTISCQEFGVRAINSASFGKAVRNAFPGIRTRRLGVRGNSKYHYVAIRPALSVEAERLNDYGDSTGQWHMVDGKVGFQANGGEAEMEDVDSDEEDFEDSPIRPPILRRHTTATPAFSAPPTPVYDLPGFPVLSPILDLGPGYSSESTQPFWNAFCRHQEALVVAIRSHQFDTYEVLCREFWIPMAPLWVQVCHHPLLSRMITDAMSATYNHIITILLEKIHTAISPLAQHALRTLADKLEPTIDQCLSIFSREFSESKIELASRSSHLLVRCVELHQLSTAVAPILSNHTQIVQMLSAWDRLDVSGLADQCALSCGCPQDVVEGILGRFRDWLSNVEADVLVGRPALELLGQMIDKFDIKQVPRAAFVTSQVMRDLTIKSDSTFGLFQLIKTWIDDWVCLSASRVASLSVVIPPNVEYDLSTAKAF